MTAHEEIALHVEECRQKIGRSRDAGDSAQCSGYMPGQAQASIRTVDQHNDRPSLAESVICQFDPISGGDELSLSHVTKAAGGLRCVMPPPKTLSLVQRSVCHQKYKM